MWRRTAKRPMPSTGGSKLASHWPVTMISPPQHGDDAPTMPLTPTASRPSISWRLYRLQQLGIVQGYTLQYSGLKNWRFEVEFEVHWQPQALLVHVEHFLERSRRRDVDDITEPMQAWLNWRRNVGFPPWPAEHLPPGNRCAQESHRHPAEANLFAGSHLRLQMLRNGLDMCGPPRTSVGESRCSTFSIKLQQPDTTDCGFCDICVPDLDFQTGTGHRSGRQRRSG